MTLSKGDLIRKQKRDDSGPVEGEMAVLFEVVNFPTHDTIGGEAVQIVVLKERA